MQVIRAAAMGMCFGVRDALRALDGVAEPAEVTIHGELVHNEEVMGDLDRRGFRSTAESDRGGVPASPEVLITAHGVSDGERRRLTDAGKRLIDTTCPLVRVVHEAAARLKREGWFVVVIGKPGHVEVQGIVGDLDPGRFAIVSGPAEVSRYDEPRIGVVCQSTARPDQARAVRLAIEERNPSAEVRFVDTICKPTKERQLAVQELLDRVEALVVVGGGNSNNTKQLARQAETRGLPVVHVRNAADLEPSWFTPYRVVGLTAGTSTLDRTIDDVHHALTTMAAS